MKELLKEIKFFLPFFKKKFYFYIIVMILIFISTGAVYMYPYLYSKILLSIREENLRTIYNLFLLMLGSSLILYIMDYIRYKLYYIQNNRIILDIKCYIFSSFFNTNLEVFQELTHSETINRIERDINDIVNTITEVIISFFTYIFSLIALVIIMFFIFPEIATITVLLSILMVFITRYYGKIMYKKQKKLLEKIDYNTMFLWESLNGITDIISLGIKKRRVDKFTELNEKANEDRINLSMDLILSSKLIGLLGLIANILVYVVGGYIIVTSNKYNYELIIAMAGYTQLFISDVTAAANINIDLSVLQASLDRIKQLLRHLQSSQESDEKNYTSCFRNIESIEFDNVSFKYSNTENVLDQVSFNIEAEDKVAIIGGNGEGKSTLIKLFLKHYKVCTGEIRVNCTNLINIENEYFQKKITVVNQTPILFNGTVMENIDHGDYYEEQLNELMDILHLDYEFLNKQVGFMGDSLSSGEKQKVAILRSFLGDFDVYIVDEIRNHIDLDSYRGIMEYMKNQLRSKIIIYITHDKDSMDYYNKIFNIKNGKLQVTSSLNS